MKEKIKITILPEQLQALVDGIKSNYYALEKELNDIMALEELDIDTYNSLRKLNIIVKKLKKFQEYRYSLFSIAFLSAIKLSKFRELSDLDISFYKYLVQIKPFYQNYNNKEGKKDITSIPKENINQIEDYVINLYLNYVIKSDQQIFQPELYDSKIEESSEVSEKIETYFNLKDSAAEPFLDINGYEKLTVLEILKLKIDKKIPNLYFL